MGQRGIMLVSRVVRAVYMIDRREAGNCVDALQSAAKRDRDTMTDSPARIQHVPGRDQRAREQRRKQQCR